MPSIIEVDIIKNLGGTKDIVTQVDGSPVLHDDVVINADNLGSGTVPTARLGSGSASGSVFLAGDSSWQAAGGGGITEADTWRITTPFTGTPEPITANWERDDSDGNGLLGTGMTLEGLSGTTSDGIFAFPSTGYWQVSYFTRHYYSSAARYVDNKIWVTVDDSSYDPAAVGSCALWSSTGDAAVGSLCMKIVKVTSTSTVKVYFSVGQSGGVTTDGSSTGNSTAAIFMRLGDI